MEEQITIFLLNYEKSVKLEAIYNLEPLVSDAKVREIRLPLEMKKFKVNITILNACMNFILSIEKNLSFNSSGQFRQKCLTAISNYYIKKKMRFQLYEYGYLSSKILATPLEKVMHIIYFMIYARLASKPYITNQIVLAKQKHSRKRNFTIKSQNDQSNHSISVDSRHFTLFMENNQIQMDLFKKELKQVLQSSSSEVKKSGGKKNDAKRYFNIKNVYPQEEIRYQKNEDNSYFNEFGPKTINIPSKVTAYENSSVISRLKLNSTQSSFCSQPQKKLHMRRQKFNEDFDCGKKYERLAKNFDKENKKNEWGSSKCIGQQFQKSSNNMRIQKHQYSYFKNMTTNIKSCNKKLDNIRTECMTQTKKKQALKEFEWNKQEQTPYKSVSYSPQEVTPHQTVRKTIGGDHENEFEQAFKRSENNKKTQIQQNEKDTSKFSATVGLITRKADNFNQEEKLLVFNKKLKNKFKLQKYKEEYRHFLKTQMFQRQKNFS